MLRSLFRTQNEQVERFPLERAIDLDHVGRCRLQFLEAAAATPAFDRRGTGTKEQLARLGNDL